MFGLKPSALSPGSFTVKINNKVPFPKLAQKGVLFLQIMLNTLSSPAFECGRKISNLATLESRLFLDCPVQLFKLDI